MQCSGLTRKKLPNKKIYIDSAGYNAVKMTRGHKCPQPENESKSEEAFQITCPSSGYGRTSKSSGRRTPPAPRRRNPAADLPQRFATVCRARFPLRYGGRDYRSGGRGQGHILQLF